MSGSVELMRRQDCVIPLLGVTTIPSWRIYCPTCGGPAVSTDPWPSECYDCVEDRVLDAPERGHWVYRLWSGDRLLYVGLTRNPADRIKAHWKRWAPLIWSVTWEECDDEFDMLAREAHAINTEHPAFNIDHPEPK